MSSINHRTICFGIRFIVLSYDCKSPYIPSKYLDGLTKIKWINQPEE